MPLPLPLRNRLADSIILSFHDPSGRQGLSGLARFCREGVRIPDASISPPFPLDWFDEVEGRLVRSAWICAKVAGDGGVEVAGRRPLAEALGLLAIGAHPVAPGLKRVRRRGTEDVSGRRIKREIRGLPSPVRGRGQASGGPTRLISPMNRTAC